MWGLGLAKPLKISHNMDLVQGSAHVAWSSEVAAGDLENWSSVPAEP